MRTITRAAKDGWPKLWKASRGAFDEFYGSHDTVKEHRERLDAWAQKEAGQALLKANDILDKRRAARLAGEAQESCQTE